MLDESRPELKDQETLLNQLNEMLALQDKMNTRVNESWKQQNFAWYRAIWTECAETLDHYGWKWWKKQSPDRDQVCMELVDIWHFGLSILLLEGAKVTAMLSDLEEPDVDPSEFRELLEDFTAATLNTKSFDLRKFRLLMAAMEMSMDDLYAQYIGKNVLNFFRQDHGYQEGTYHKQWNGREDNEHLVEVLGGLDPAKEGFAEALYAELESRYPKN